MPETWIVMFYLSIHGETQLLHTFVHYHWSCVTYMSSEGQNPASGCTGQISRCIITAVLAAGSDYYYFYHLVMLSLRLLKPNSLMPVPCARPSLTWASLWLPSPHSAVICKTDPASLRCACYLETMSPALFGCDDTPHRKICLNSRVLMILSWVFLGLKYSQWIYP